MQKRNDGTQIKFLPGQNFSVEKILRTNTYLQALDVSSMSSF